MTFARFGIVTLTALSASVGLIGTLEAENGRTDDVRARTWVLNHGAAAAQAKVEGGYGAVRKGLFGMLASGWDVTLTLPLSKDDAFAAEALPVFALRYRMHSAQKCGGIFFTTDTLTRLCDRSFTSFPVVGDGTWRNVCRDMRTAPTRDVWKGTVTGFRLDPVNPSASGDRIEISRLGFFSNTAEAERFLAAADDRPDQESRTNEVPVFAWRRDRFQIGAYCLNPPQIRTRDVIRDIKACGIDFIVGVPVHDTKAMECFRQEGVGVVTTGVVPGWWGGDGSRAGKLKDVNPLSVYRWCVDGLVRPAAMTAIDIGDEPSALDFPHYGQVVKTLQASCPEVPLYLNLYPNYASVAKNSDRQTRNQLGTPTYREHIAEYCKHVPLPYISYDFYPYMSKTGVNDRFRLRMYDNFKIVADACRATHRDFWYIPQVNSFYPELHMTENTLRFQAYAAMAFGAVSITWGCYTPGWWVNNVLRADGTKNVEYDRLKTVNRELRTLAVPFMRYRNTATHFVGFPATEKLDTVGIEVLKQLDCGPFTGVKLADNASLLVGEMTARTGEGSALFVLAADDMYDRKPTKHTLRFQAKSGRVRAFGGNGEIPVSPDATGISQLELVSNQALLITLTGSD